MSDRDGQSDMAKNAVVHDPKSYVAYRGVVEVKYGTENEEVEWRKDLYDYVREDLPEHPGGRFENDFCTKNKQTNKRYWFDCLVCPCVLYRDENLVFHVNGLKHQKRVTEKIAGAPGPSRSSGFGGGGRRTHEPVRSSFKSSSKDFLAEIIEGSPNYPFLGLRYITEYQNPSNPDKDRMYTCSLRGCKSTWGDARTLFNHLKSDKNKHNKNYLVENYDLHINLTREQIYNKSQDVYEKEYKGRRVKATDEIKTVKILSSYKEIKNRSLDWSESKNKIKAECHSDLKEYRPQNSEQKAKFAEEAMDTMQTQISLTMEKVQNNRHVNFDTQMRDSLTHSTDQARSMLEIIQRHKKHLSHRMSNFKDNQEDMDRIFHEIKRSDDVANSHMNMMGMGMEFEDKDKPKNKPSLSTSSSYYQSPSDSHRRYRNNSNSMDNFQFEESKSDMKRSYHRMSTSNQGDQGAADVERRPKMSKYDQEKVLMEKFKDSVEELVQRCLVKNGYGPHESDFEIKKMQITGKISSAELDTFVKKHGRENLAQLKLDEVKIKNIEKYVAQKLKSFRS